MTELDDAEWGGPRGEGIITLSILYSGVVLGSPETISRGGYTNIII
jgi:hypothetical protein